MAGATLAARLEEVIMTWIEGVQEVRPCRCRHEFQDEVYGKGMRVHRAARKEGDWRCTVCFPSGLSRRMRILALGLGIGAVFSKRKQR